VAVGNEAAQGAADPGRFIACQYVGGSERDGTIRQSVRAIYAPKGTDTSGRTEDEHADTDGVLACWLGEGGWRLEWLCGPPVARESANADSCVSVASGLPSLGSSLTANAYPTGTNEFSFGERRQSSSGVLTPLVPTSSPKSAVAPGAMYWVWRTILELWHRL
jgi:hypothetical protein